NERAGAVGRQNRKTFPCRDGQWRRPSPIRAAPQTQVGRDTQPIFRGWLSAFPSPTPEASGDQFPVADRPAEVVIRPVRRVRERWSKQRTPASTSGRVCTKCTLTAAHGKLRGIDQH